jgi:hypothetical protein
MVVVFVVLCFASKKPSEREFFVPAGTDLGVKLLNPFFTFKSSPYGTLLSVMAISSWLLSST